MLHWPELITSGKKMQPLTKQQVKDILTRAYFNIEDRRVGPDHFFLNRGWEMRQNTFDYLFQRYNDDKRLRMALNSYFFENKQWQDHIIMDMAQVIKNKECFILELTGPTGSGKSRLTVFLLQSYNFLKQHAMNIILSPKDITRFIVDNPFNFKESSNMYLTYHTSETTKVFREHVKEWDSIMQDESPFQHGKGSIVERHGFENVVATATRRNCISLVIINPTIIELENVNYYIEVVGVKRKTLETCCILYDKTCSPLGVCEFMTTIEPETWRAYERESKIRKDEILKSGGYSGVVVTDEELEEFVRGYLQWCVEHNVRTRQQVNLFVPRYPPLANFTHKDIVCEMTWIELQTRRRAQRQADRETDADNEDRITEPEGFENAEEYELPADPAPAPKSEVGKEAKTFAEYAQKTYRLSRPKEIATEILLSAMRYWLEGITNEQVAIKVGYKSESSVADILRKPREDFLGYAYEEWEALKRGVEPETAHNESKADLVIAYKDNERWNYFMHPERQFDRLEVFSIKFTASKRPIKYETFGKKGCYPEAMFCIEHNIEEFTLVVYNLYNEERIPSSGMFQENAKEIRVNPRKVREIKLDKNYSVKLIAGKGSGN